MATAHELQEMINNLETTSEQIITEYNALISLRTRLLHISHDTAPVDELPFNVLLLAYAQAYTDMVHAFESFTKGFHRCSRSLGTSEQPINSVPQSDLR